MADGITLSTNIGSGAVIKTDDDGTYHWQLVKVAFGGDNTQTEVTSSVGLPTTLLAGTAEFGKLAAGVAEIGNVKNSGTFATQATLQAGTAEIGKLAAGVAEIGNVKNSGTFAVQSTLSAETTKVIGTVNMAAGQTIATTNAGTFATQATLQAGTAEIGKLAAGVAEIGNVKNSGTFAVQSTLSAETTKVIGTVNIAAGHTTAVTNAGTFATQATLQAGSAAIGKLSPNTGVDIGDVDVTSISAGANLIGDVGLSGARTSGGTTIFRSIDLDEGALEVVKGSAGQIYWIYALNVATTPVYMKIYNATSGTIGTGTPVLTFAIPSQGTAGGAGFTLSVPNGIAFSTGISVGASTAVADADTGAPATNSLMVNIGYA